MGILLGHFTELKALILAETTAFSQNCPRQKLNKKRRKFY